MRCGLKRSLDACLSKAFLLSDKFIFFKISKSNHEIDIVPYGHEDPLMLASISNIIAWAWKINFDNL